MESSVIALKPLSPGRYVVGVSGGVDSVVLFDLLKNMTGIELVVAHFDHGMRQNSQQDRKFVQSLAMSHNVLFEFQEGNLGSDASEEAARKARYAFLRHIGKKYNAAGIIVAHHQDDLLETAAINLIRGTGWRGLSSLRSHEKLLRPLLQVPKAHIVAYAIEHGLQWRDDETNFDTTYLRNYVRQVIFTRLTPQARKKLLQIIVRQQNLTEAIDAAMQTWLKKNMNPAGKGTSLPRYQLIMLPSSAALELLQGWMREVTGKSIERPLAHRALLFCKTGRLHRRFELNAAWQLRLDRHVVIVEPRQHMIS